MRAAGAELPTPFLLWIFALSQKAVRATQKDRVLRRFAKTHPEKPVPIARTWLRSCGIFRLEQLIHSAEDFAQGGMRVIAKRVLRRFLRK